MAENLVSEQNDITVIDTDVGQLRYLQDRFDLRVVQGDGIQVSVLESAGADDTDLFIACAASDAANLVACKIAREVFNVPRRIARIRMPEFADHPELMSDEGFAIDALISPERSVTTYLHSLIEFPEALQVVEFAGGRVSVITVRVGHGSPMAHHPVDELREVWPDVTARIVDVLRDGRPLHAGTGTVVAPGDEVVLAVDTRHARRAVRQLREAEKTVHRVMIAGGGNIGLRLARQLAEEGYSVRIIEHDAKRCEYLAAELPDNVLVLHGNGTDEALLERENIEDMDTWLALTSDDEDNIMSSLLAKRLGARKVIALINRQAYGELMQGSHIDVAVSPSQATMSELLRHVRRGDVVAVHRLRQGWPRPWRPSPMATAPTRGWSAARWARSGCPRAPASACWCVATRSSFPTPTPKSSRTTMSSFSCLRAGRCRASRNCSRCRPPFSEPRGRARAPGHDVERYS